MANEQQGPLSLKCAAAVEIFRGVRLTGTGLNVPAAAGGTIIGVTLRKGAIGKTVPVECRPGYRVIVEGGGAFAMGDKLKVDANGKFVQAAGADLTDGSVVAQATEACAGDGKRASAILLTTTKA